MSQLTCPQPNKLPAGYARQWVFGTCGGGSCGDSRGFEPASASVDRVQARDLRSIERAAAGGFTLLPVAASMPRYQALSGVAGAAVAQVPSHSGEGMADFCAFAGDRRLIANYQTAGADRDREAAGRADLGAIGRGGRPPSTARALSPCPSRRPDLEFGEFGQARGCAKSAPPAGCIGAAKGLGRKLPPTRMGSGVGGCGRAKGSARGASLRLVRDGVRGKNRDFGQDLVRPGKTCTLGGGAA